MTSYVRICNLDAGSGFEAFTMQIHAIITEEGKEAYYVFDCLSDLLDAWTTDLMIGNFFMVICPYLFELDTITYFALLRDRHSFKTIARIRETTQLLLDLVAVRDHQLARQARQRGTKNAEYWLLTFEKLLSETKESKTTILLSGQTGNDHAEPGSSCQFS